MTRVTRGFVAKKRRKRVLKLAKGFRGSHSVLFRTAQQRTMRALSLAYRDRRLYKRNIRSLWIRRINSFLRDNGSRGTEVDQSNNSPKRSSSYSSFIHQLKKSNILLNRKVLAQLAIFDPISMNKIAEMGGASS
jgi:large subunit ribosomal protein L20